jgi:hypothetical protein
MNDELETRLRSAFRSESLPAAPATLFRALDAVLAEPVRPGSGSPRRLPWGVVAVAAVLMVGGAVALSVGNRGPSPAPSPLASSVAVSPSTPASQGVPTVLRFSPQWAPRQANVDNLRAIVRMLEDRLDAAGVVGAVVRTNAYDVLLEVPAGLDAQPIRELLTPVGLFTIVPVEFGAVHRGDSIDPALPVLIDSSTGVEASVVATSSGGWGLLLQFSDEVSPRLADYTAANVGSTIALVLDGIVVAAPMINETLPDGAVQIEFGLVDADAPDRDELSRIAAVIEHGPLAAPLVEVATEATPSSAASPTAISDREIQCEALLDVEGPQLDCVTAVRQALAILPAGHPRIARVAFVHECNDVRQPGVVLDCFVQAFGVVTVTFVDGSPPVRIGLSLGTPPFIIPALPAPSG